VKKNTLIIIAGIVANIIILGIVFYITNNKKIKANDDFIYMDYYNDIKKSSNYVFTNYYDYYNVFNSNKLTKEDFKNNNYALITINYDSCSESNITPTDYTIKDNKINVTVKYKRSCGVCAPRYIYYLLKIDKNITYADINVDYKAINNPHCDPNVSYKPLIYIYPKVNTNVTIKLGYPNLLTTTYPKYKNGWNVIAKPNGDLIDKDGKTYYGLYWEGYNNIKEDFKDGFVVSKKDTISFLEEKLKILGLNQRETNEFIIYWLPKLEENDYNLIRFKDINSINEQMPLDINPSPDSIIRVFMVYKPIKDKVNIKEQELASPKRDGFTVIEWGGSLVK